MTMHEQFREFNKDDYRVFAGVSRFADGSAPMIYEGIPEVLIIVCGSEEDKKNASLHVIIGEDQYSFEIRHDAPIFGPYAGNFVTREGAVNYAVSFVGMYERAGMDYFREKITNGVGFEKIY